MWRRRARWVRCSAGERSSDWPAGSSKASSRSRRRSSDRSSGTGRQPWSGWPRSSPSRSRPRHQRVVRRDRVDGPSSAGSPRSGSVPKPNASGALTTTEAGLSPGDRCAGSRASPAVRPAPSKVRSTDASGEPVRRRRCPSHSLDRCRARTPGRSRDGCRLGGSAGGSFSVRGPSRARPLPGRWRLRGRSGLPGRSSRHPRTRNDPVDGSRRSCSGDRRGSVRSPVRGSARW